MNANGINYQKMIGAGMAALGFTLFSLLVWPIWGGLSELRAAIENKQEILDQRKSVLERVSSLKRTVTSKKENIDQLNTILPDDKKTQEIVVNIEEAARQTGITLRELKTAEVESVGRESGYQTLQVELSGTGIYGSVLEFFKALEGNLRIFDVQEFTVSLDSTGEALGLLNIDLKLLTYYLSNQNNKEK